MKNQYTTTPELKQARNEIILRMRKEGYTLQKIADRFDVGREWIRQILKKEFEVTGCVSFDPSEEKMSDEYSAADLVEFTGYEMEYIRVQLAKNWLPKPSRKLAPKTRAIESSYHIVAPGQTLSTISKFHLPLCLNLQKK